MEVRRGGISGCSRPRLYWLMWELHPAGRNNVSRSSRCSFDSLVLEANHDLEEVCKDGWIKVDPSRPFPTFTTPRPRATGYEPAGLSQCSDGEVRRWQGNNYRYLPYQYCTRNCLISQRNEIRLPASEEKAAMLGFPVGYITPCSAKADRLGHTPFIGGEHLVSPCSGLATQPLWGYVHMD